MPWHLSKSDAFHDLFANALDDRLEIDLRDYDQVQSWQDEPRDVPLVFCQVYPPRELLDDPARRIVWIPMWDSVQGDGEGFWQSLPQTLRIVALSEAVASHSGAAGLPTLRISYSKDPDELGEASWGDGRVVFYWNRTGLVGPAFLEQLCLVANAHTLLYRDELDAGIPVERRYDLPGELGGATVVQIAASSRAEYLAAVEPANVVLAPRPAEGVGMIFLEAMARGCAVLSYDGPTMNEYVEHGRNGYVFGRTDRPRLSQRFRVRRDGPFTLSPARDWADVAAADLEALGAAARSDQRAGRARWLETLPDYARFISDW
jgi:glycosyltransferase involved in cell wall biosynthesis